ncbi:DDE-type integrase/transposase/recombinase [Micromonospora sp. NPDC005163]
MDYRTEYRTSPVTLGHVPRRCQHFGRQPPARGCVAVDRRLREPSSVSRSLLDELVPSAWHDVEQYTNNPIEAAHSQLKHRLRPMRGLRTDKTAQVIIRPHVHAEPPPRTLRTRC